MVKKTLQFSNFVVALVVLLLCVPTGASATVYTMDFETDSSGWTQEYDEDGFRVKAVDSGDGVDELLLALGTMSLGPVNTADEAFFDHFDLAFDLVSLDYALIFGEATLTSSTGSSVTLNGLGTFEFDSDWYNITSFSLLTEGYLVIDNVKFENAPTTVPEPGTLLLLGAGLLGLAGCGGLRRRKQG